MRAEATARRPPHRGWLGWAGRRAGPAAASPNLPARPGGAVSRDRPALAPRAAPEAVEARTLPPTVHTPRLSGVAGPLDAEGQPLSSAARGEASPARRGGRAAAGTGAAGASPSSPTQLLGSDSGSPQAGDGAARLQAGNRCPDAGPWGFRGASRSPQGLTVEGLRWVEFGVQGARGERLEGGRCWR